MLTENLNELLASLKDRLNGGGRIKPGPADGTMKRSSGADGSAGAEIRSAGADNSAADDMKTDKLGTDS